MLSLIYCTLCYQVIHLPLPYERKSFLLFLDDKLSQMKVEFTAALYQIWLQVEKKSSGFKLSLIERGRKCIPDSQMISYCTSSSW